MIRKKLIRKTKIPNRDTLERQVLEAAELAADVQVAIDRKFRIVQLDECFVTLNTIPKTAWSLKKTNILIDHKETNMNASSVIAAVSREYGIDHIVVGTRSITKIKFH